MVHRREIEAQLKSVGVVIKSWGAAEVRELANIAVPGEEIKSLINGWYENGFATLVATNQRLLLIDKKPLYLAVEDLRYDMIAEVDYSAGVLSAQLCVNTVNKRMEFKSIRHRRLRDMAALVQFQVMQGRRQQWAVAQQFDQPQDSAQPSIEWLPQAATLGGRLVSTSMPTPPVSPAAYPGPSLTMITKHQFLPRVRRHRPPNFT
jgi:hypothetical protein